jgi:hypothetical protein
MKLGLRHGPPLRAHEISATGHAATGHPRPWHVVIADTGAFLGQGLLAGLICGAVVGGVGGRLAMFVLRLTSDDALHGRETDDGFAIGAVTSATLFLILFAALLGAAGGLVYLGVREWLPPRWRPVLLALVGATVGGTMVIQPDGIDFTLLDPLWLAVVLFVLLPAGYGAGLSLLTERFVRSARWQRSRWRWIAVLPLGLVVLAGGLTGLVVLLLAGLVVGANRAGHVGRLWRSGPVTWLGRGVVAAAIGGGGILLARDVVAVL